MTLKTLDFTKKFASADDDELAVYIRTLQNEVSAVAKELKKRGWSISAEAVRDYDDRYKRSYRDDYYKPTQEYKIRISKIQTIETTI